MVWLRWRTWELEALLPVAEEMLKTRLMTLGSTVPLPRASSDLRANLCTPVRTAANGRECRNAGQSRESEGGAVIQEPRVGLVLGKWLMPPMKSM